MMKNVFITLLLSAITLSAKAQQMYENKNINYSFNVIEAEAAKGNVAAIKALGDCYNYGKQYNATYTGAVDYNKALECYKKISDYGYPWGAWEIARMYGAGKLEDADAKTSAEIWYEKAFKEFKIYADRGDAKAMDNLAEYYAGYNGDKYQDGLKNTYIGHFAHSKQETQVRQQILPFAILMIKVWKKTPCLPWRGMHVFV